jgi:uncharacterized protein (DUF2141 family)
LVVLALVFAGQAVWGQNKVVANISSFENNKGICRACIFGSEEAFKKSRPLQCVLTPVTNKISQAVFTNVPDGTYALFVFHDTNNNGKMDTNFLGIPKEGYGASQNKLPFAAAPKFEANKFSLSGNSVVTLSIKLRNI